MLCKIGITTNPDKKLKYWQKKHSRVVNWNILETCETKSQARAKELQWAHRRRCETVPADKGDENATWHIYRFEY